MKKNKIIHGDCLKVMKRIPNNYVDTIITDPPYGLSFMGKKWDYDVPSIEIWKECLRVLKPGGTALIFAGSRTQHRMAVNVEDAGFILKDCIMWLYGSGFPKATDLSLQFDKKACMEQLTKQLGRTPNKKEFDDAWKVFREVVGLSNRAIAKNPTATTFAGQDKNFSESAEGREASKYITAPATPEAILWNGWKSHGLKPAYEPILVAMKPNDGTYANNALVHGVSGLNIDGGRIGTKTRTNAHTDKAAQKCYGGGLGEIKSEVKDYGRFPSNTILSCTCEDEHEPDCPVRMLDEQSGECKGFSGGGGGRTGTFKMGEVLDNYQYFNDSGGASRFFYIAKASKSERNKGCRKIEFVREADREMDDRPGGENPKNRTNTKKQNFHPTVKPLALMEYLCKLTKTPTGGIVLDPFAGSGTTGLACLNTQRQFILIEKKLKYIKIAKARIRGRKRKRRLFDES